MDEHSFVRSVHNQLPSRVHRWKINARFARGVPDAWYSGDRGDVWVEYKWLPRTPVRQFTVELSGNQRKWLRDRHLEGRTVAVIIGTPSGAVVLTGRQWEQTQKVVGEWMTRRQVAQWIEALTCSTSTSPQ